MAPKGWSYRLTMVLTGCIQNFLMGGVVFGWAAISSTMLVSDEQAPGLSTELVHRMFVMAATANMCSPLLLGGVLDKYGPRVCSLLSITIVAIGFVMFGSIKGASDLLYYIAVILIGFGGPGVQSSVIHLSNLFPDKKATVTAFLTGCFQLSFCIFFFFDQIWFFGGVDYRTIFIAYGVICCLSFVASFFMWPDEPFHFSDEVLTASPATLTRIKKEMSSHLIRYPSTFLSHDNLALNVDECTPFGNPDPNESERLKKGTLKEQLMSRPFVIASVFLTVSSFWANYTIASLDFKLQDEDYMSPHQQGNCLRYFTLITVCGTIGIPVVGYMMDHMGFRVTITATISLGVLWCLLSFIHVEWVLLSSFCAYALFRSFTFNFYFAYLADQLGFRYFGVLAGGGFALAGVAGLGQQTLFEWAHAPCVEPGATPESCHHGYWTTVNIFKFACIAMLFILPCFMPDHKPPLDIKRDMRVEIDIDPRHHAQTPRSYSSFGQPHQYSAL